MHTLPSYLPQPAKNNNPNNFTEEVLMREQIGDESIFLRISELKKGNVQFTDSTNAARLIREHGRDIRYNAAWKKWIVWGGTHWELDEGGALIHEKNL